MHPVLEEIKNDIGNDEIRDRIGTEYSVWFYASSVWRGLNYCGINTLKSPMDMWNYQEILTERRPSLVIEFGTLHGGSALFFANIMQNLGSPYRVLTVDTEDNVTSHLVKNHPNIERIKDMSIADKVRNRIQDLREEFPGQIFIILDSDHRALNVFNELMMIKGILKKDDYVVVEDTNINGHPLPIDAGEPGAWEALDMYTLQFPNDYIKDLSREKKFGWTFATDGYLIKT